MQLYTVLIKPPINDLKCLESCTAYSTLVLEERPSPEPRQRGLFLKYGVEVVKNAATTTVTVGGCLIASGKLKALVRCCSHI